MNINSVQYNIFDTDYFIEQILQNIKDWVQMLGVLMFVTIDLVLLTLNVIIDEALGASEAVLVPNKDNPHTITGVRIVQFGPN